MKLLIALAVCITSMTVSGAPIQWTVASGGNDHWYELSTQSNLWSAARVDALSRSFAGQSGYLATVTSAAENTFILLNVKTVSSAWIGGSDSSIEGEWRWIDGPEAGTLFWQAGIGTVTYASWNAGEPNNGAGPEMYLEYAGDGWNDASDTSRGAQQYIIEYSPANSEVPEPSSYLLMACGLICGVCRLRFVRQ